MIENAALLILRSLPMRERELKHVRLTGELLLGCRSPCGSVN